MSGAIAGFVGGSQSSSLAVAANNVIRVDYGEGASGPVRTLQLPNTRVTGGLGPYTFLWEYLSGATDTVCEEPTAQNPHWSGEVFEVTPQISEWRVTVEDSLGATATADITVTLIWSVR